MTESDLDAMYLNAVSTSTEEECFASKLEREFLGVVLIINHVSK